MSAAIQRPSNAALPRPERRAGDEQVTSLAPIQRPSDAALLPRPEGKERRAGWAAPEGKISPKIVERPTTARVQRQPAVKLPRDALRQAFVDQVKPYTLNP